MVELFNLIIKKPVSYSGFEVPIVRKLFNDFKDEKRKLSGDNDKNILG